MDKPSCISREPLSKLADNGSAAILNYNLPQLTTYEVVSFIRLDIKESLFKQAERKAPPDNYWVTVNSTASLLSRAGRVRLSATGWQRSAASTAAG